MSTPPAPKRRRVEPLGIHKPFVSPLKRSAPSAATNTPAPSRTQPVPSTPYTPLRSSNLKTSTPLSFTPQDPEIVQAQQVVKNLEAQIRGLRSENGILSQAVQITGVTHQSSASQQSTSSSTQQQQPQQQPRLIRLTQKWLKASQLAAEEVFTSFAQQIKDNGGYTTYLAQQKQNTTSRFYNDEDREEQGKETNEDNWRDEDGDVLTERGKRQRRGEIEERACEKETEEQAEAEEEEDELSLGTMLQVLNIDPEVIGWDTKSLAWK
jgi:Swi5-dependent recombination DNA repair protein 1